MPRTARASDLKAHIARRLRAARSIRFLSSDACAKALEIPINTWRNWEIGDKYPHPTGLVKFCDATGFTVDFLYRGRFRGIEEKVQIRLAAQYPELVDEAPDMQDESVKVDVPA
jgi:transcriptional regulator with XRE-family HTH domain